MEFCLIKRVTKTESPKVRLLSEIESLKEEIDSLYSGKARVDFFNTEERIEIRKKILDVLLNKIKTIDFND